jgi:hypothetical protein
MKKHEILMLLGCALPLFLIFLLPVFGITDNVFLILLFLVLMLICHLMMPMHGGKHNHQGGRESKTGD